MKMVSLVLSVVLVLGVVLGNNAYAANEGWYVAGGVLAGLATAAIISDAARPRYYYARPCYVRPVYAVRPVYCYNRYDNYRNYSYVTSPYTTATVYEHEVVHTW